MQRRTFVKSIGTITTASTIAIAGCSSNGNSNGGGDGEATPSPTQPEATVADGIDVRDYVTSDAFDEVAELNGVTVEASDEIVVTVEITASEDITEDLAVEMFINGMNSDDEPVDEARIVEAFDPGENRGVQYRLRNTEGVTYITGSVGLDES